MNDIDSIQLKNISSTCDNREYSRELIPGKVCEMAKDPTGCRYLQAVLMDESSGSEWYTLMYQEAKEQMHDLISDPYGNYFSQILFEYVSDDFKLAILEELSSYVLEASKSMFATRFIQRTIELSSENEKFIDVIVQGLKPHVLDICFNCNGRHVIQTCLKRFPVDRCGPILEIAFEHCK